MLHRLRDSLNAGENSGENGENNDENKVLEIIRKVPRITQLQIAAETGFSIRKVNRLISSLRTRGKIIRIGKTKGGIGKSTTKTVISDFDTCQKNRTKSN